MYNKKGSVRFSTMFLALAFVALVVGAVFEFSPLSRGEMPPSLNPGATLFQGKLTVADNLSYYFVKEKTDVASLIKCLGVGEKAGFVSYNDGYHVYQLADKDSTVIVDPGSFDIFPGKVFGLVVDGTVNSECALATTEVSGIGLDKVLNYFTSEWEQVVAGSSSLSEVVAPIKDRVVEMWVQNGVDSFRKIDLQNIDNESFSGFYAIWLKM